jgi:hypothetical protein
MGLGFGDSMGQKTPSLWDFRQKPWDSACFVVREEMHATPIK